MRKNFSTLHGAAAILSLRRRPYFKDASPTPQRARIRNRPSANNAKTPEKSTTVAGSGAETRVTVPSSEVVSLYCRSKFVSALKPVLYESAV